jgi:hypothetical protein
MHDEETGIKIMYFLTFGQSCTYIPDRSVRTGSGWKTQEIAGDFPAGSYRNFLGPGSGIIDLGNILSIYL